MDWAKAPAATVVCEESGITLRDVVQSIMDGAETSDEVIEMLELDESEKGIENIGEIVHVFLPVVNAWKGGSCGGGCAGCSGSCGSQG